MREANDKLAELRRPKKGISVLGVVFGVHCKGIARVLYNSIAARVLYFHICFIFISVTFQYYFTGTVLAISNRQQGVGDQNAVDKYSAIMLVMSTRSLLPGTLHILGSCAISIHFSAVTARSRDSHCTNTSYFAFL